MQITLDVCLPLRDGKGYVTASKWLFLSCARVRGSRQKSGKALSTEQITALLQALSNLGERHMDTCYGLVLCPWAW